MMMIRDEGGCYDVCRDTWFDMCRDICVRAADVV